MSSVLWIDYRTGSIELLPEFTKQGLDARKATLDSADFAFQGHGPDGSAEFGVERKTLTDFVDSARTGRLYGVGIETQAGGTREAQLARMLTTYDFPWLLIEGDYSTDAKGRLVQLIRHRNVKPVPGNFSEDSLNKTLLSLDLRAGIRVKETNNSRQTVRWVTSLFRSHTDKRWDQHTTLRTPQRRESPKPVSQFRDIVMRFEDVGFAASKAVETHVNAQLPNGRSLQAQISALLSMTLHDWESLDVPAGRAGETKKFGTPRALRVVDTLRRLR